jgi:quaternary ammonium compound-resistance protein SugE
MSAHRFAVQFPRASRLDRTREPYPEGDKTAAQESVMAWLVLVLSGVLEAVWAVALGKSEGFSRLTPSLVFVVGIVLSMGGLAYALRTVPVGTGYAVWVGIGAALTVAFGMVVGEESVTAVKVLLLAGLIACVVGLKLAH